MNPMTSESVETLVEAEQMEATVDALKLTTVRVIDLKHTMRILWCVLCLIVITQTRWAVAFGDPLTFFTGHLAILGLVGGLLGNPTRLVLDPPSLRRLHRWMGSHTETLTTGETK